MWKQTIWNSNITPKSFYQVALEMWMVAYVDGSLYVL